MSVSVTSSLTPNYQFQLPIVGGDQDSWGAELNGNWSKLDGILQSISAGGGGGTAGSGAYLPIGGGTMTGALYLANDPTSYMMAATGGWVSANFAQLSNPTFSGTVTANAVHALGLNAGYPTVSDFWLALNGNNRVLNWAYNVYDQYVPSTGIFYRSWAGTNIMVMDGTGNTTITGNAYKPGGGPWAASSDDRVKASVKPYTAGLDAVLQLAPIAYTYNGQGGTPADGRTYYGLSAQATRPVMPELVCNMPAMANAKTPIPGLLGTDLTALPLALLNAIRELAERVAALEGEGA